MMARRPTSRRRTDVKEDHVPIPPPRPRARTKVLSVIGPGRSGTTILARILAENAGVVDAGELRWQWGRGVLEERPCGCGQKQRDCPVWSRIVPRVLGVQSGWAAADQIEAAARELVRHQAELDLRRHRLRLLRAATAHPDWTSLQTVRKARAQLCWELATVAGADLVVDTSKGAQDAAILAGAPELDHYVVHIVRDPRAVAHSWRRRKPHPLGEGLPTLATRPLPLSVERWAENCVSIGVLRRYLPPERWLFLRYEDFAAQPAASVERIFGFVGLPAKSPVGPGGTVVLGTSHTVAGNTDRFRTGEMRIVADEEWRRCMPRREQIGVGLMTAPLLRHYGYPVIPQVAS
jgi:hypothetical protein